MLTLLFALLALLTPSHATQAVAIEPIHPIGVIHRLQIPRSSNRPTRPAPSPTGSRTVNELRCHDIFSAPIYGTFGRVAYFPQCMDAPDGDEVPVCTWYFGDGTWADAQVPSPTSCPQGSSGGMIDPNALVVQRQ